MVSRPCPLPADHHSARQPGSSIHRWRAERRCIRRQLVLPTGANYTGRTLQCDIKSRLLLPSLSFSCSFLLSVR
ncbi:hypothetical protein ELV02_24390, partial [Escherichia coli]